ncbi:UNVERIFIED_ORG: L-iditol 2-dehydrogenase [Arthrobacter globiformis]|nr:L-iditol 2-dehydrogenase [Arthrobacter globiformis]
MSATTQGTRALAIGTKSRNHGATPFLAGHTPRSIFNQDTRCPSQETNLENPMLAACLSAPGIIDLAEFKEPTPPEDGVVVEMHFASICGSDIHITFDGLHDPDLLGKPGYPGHEGVGIVVESRTERFPIGTPVLTVPPGPAGGCFAQFQAVNASHLLALPDSLAMQRAMMAQQLGTTVFALKKFLTPERAATVRTAAVIGAGSAGLFFLQQLIRAGVQTVVSDLDPQRLALARQLGASRVVLPPDESLAEAAVEASSGQGVDLVIEAAGYDSCRAEAVEIVRPGGIIGLFGYPERKGSSPFPVHRAFRKSVTAEWISGTQSERGLTSFRNALEMIRSRTVEVDYCLEAMYPLEQLKIALEAARAQGRGAAKVGFSIAGDARLDLPTLASATTAFGH